MQLGRGLTLSNPNFMSELSKPLSSHLRAIFVQLCLEPCVRTHPTEDEHYYTVRYCHLNVVRYALLLQTEISNSCCTLSPSYDWNRK